MSSGIATCASPRVQVFVAKTPSVAPLRRKRAFQCQPHLRDRDGVSAGVDATYRITKD